MRNRSIAIALVVALVATAGWWFALYNPKNDQLAAVEQEIDGLLAQQQQLRNEITQLRQVEADEDEIRAALERLIDYVPAGIDEAAVIRQLQASADSAGVAITSLTFGDPEPLVDAPAGPSPDLALAEIPLTMVLQGTYFQVVDFLRRVEVEVPRAVLIDSLSMAEGEEGYPQLTTTWAGEVFAEVPIVMPEAAAPAPGTPAPAATGEPAPAAAAGGASGAQG